MRAMKGYLLDKLKGNGISDKLLNTVKIFLRQRKQRVVLNGQYSSSAAIEARVPQGSILGPLFFLIYITTYLMIQHLTQNYFQMIHHYFL